jgi:DNA-binding beta-propeller fold protein YncE
MNMSCKRAIALVSMALLAKWGVCENNPETSIAPPGMVFELLALNKDIATAARPKYRSPCDIVPSPDSIFLYVAEQTAKRISVVDIKTQTVKKTISLPNEVTGIAVARNGMLYATCSSDWWPNGMVCEVQPDRGKVLRRLPGGHGARSPVISHDDKTLYVCNQHGDDVYVIDIPSGDLLAKMGAMREPYSAALTPNDSILVVANCLPVQRATDTLKIASKILLFDTHARKLNDTIPLPTGSHSVFGIAMSPDGNYAFATHLIAMFTLPATKVDGGWIHTNNVAIVDIKKRKILNDATLDSPFEGAGNPWGISCTPDGKILCVAHSGSNNLSIIDLDSLISIAKNSDYSPDAIRDVTAAVTLSHNLVALRTVMKKVIVKGKAPRAITCIGNMAYTAGYFDDFIEEYELHAPESDISTTRSNTIDLGTKVPETSERTGECAYFDASLCLQKWQSCQSCHPLTRTDGLNWTLRNEVPAPKNAKSMLYSWWTPPTSWAGGRANAAESIRAGMINELFLQPDLTVAGNMDTFFMKLKPVPSPHLVKGRMDSSAIRGKDIFLHHPTLDCKTCHVPPLYVDLLRKRDGGIPDPYDARTQWDTPTIIESWRSAPYDHLGSMDQMKDVLKFKGHSNAGELPDKDFNDMTEFILSL